MVEVLGSLTPHMADQDALADMVKQVHAKLRRDFKSGYHDNVVELWHSHLKDKETLSTYSQAMAALAKGPWAMKQNNRIQWCVDHCVEYFHLDVLQKLLSKDLRRIDHGMPSVVCVECVPCSMESVEGVVQEFRGRRLRLLDVGSCYNPFNDLPQFDVTAVDIAPACETVLEYDFLTDGPSQDSLIKPNHYDVVIFSLLLSYLPSPQQRLQCCSHAHTALKLHGLLLIVTPDSSHQNRHAALMKCWKANIEALGFHRWKYDKETHLHCMAFRKTTLKLGSVNKEGLVIPQDTNDEMTSVAMETTRIAMETTQSDDQETFKELPFEQNEPENT